MVPFLSRTMRGYLPAFLNGTLDPVRRRIVSMLIQRDESMKNEVHRLMLLRSSVRAQPVLTPDPGVLRRIKESASHTNRQTSLKWRPALLWSAVIGVLAAAALLLWQALPPGLEISWSLAGQTPDSFRIYRAPVGSSQSGDFSLIGELPAQEGVARYDYTDLRLLPGQQYRYQVQAVDSLGNMVTSEAMIGDALDALPRQLAFFAIFVMLLFAAFTVLRQYRIKPPPLARLAL
jgi:hypothetical protein